jgi:hypothetical protein
MPGRGCLLSGLIYKRRHSPECLADIEKRIAQGKLKPPADRGKFLAQYKGCRCPWWARGTNKFRQRIPKQSTGCDLLADAEMVRQKLYNADLKRKEPEAPRAEVLSLQQVLEKWDARKLKGTSANPRPETTRENSRRRKVAKAERAKRRWNPDAVVKLELIDLLDWIEAELDRIEASASVT